eukprot:9267420-Karenia_brevis.AAC.1
MQAIVNELREQTSEKLKDATTDTSVIHQRLKDLEEHINAMAISQKHTRGVEKEVPSPSRPNPGA